MFPGNPRYRLFRLACVGLLAASLLLCSWAAAQEMMVEGQPMTREQAEAMMRAKAEAEAKARGEKDKESDKKKEEGEKKKGDEKDKKKEEEAPSIKRPDKPPRVPDPRELEVTLDAQGRVPPFNFIGQPWPDVLQWLANVSKCSLDWQELPADYLNLTTQRSYALDEVRDLVNRQLHARGYTMLLGGEVLSVFKIDKLDPSLLPRVTEDDLYDLRPYDFVKVSFELPEKMAADKAAEDVKKVLSPNAKVFPLVTTKRILVIDAVANLRLVSALLNEERMAEAGRIVPREFVLKYARAEQVIDILYVVLGLDPKSRPTQMELQLQQQRLQLMTQMQQKGTDVSKMLKQDGPPVFLAYNRQRNSVLANAPPEQMRIIERAIEYLDVPFGDAGGPQAGSSEQAGSRAPSAVADGRTPVGADERIMEKYPLTTLDPQNFLMTLEEIGGLDPRTDLKVDAKSRTLFALATKADHEKIARLIDQFDGEGRRFAVIQLRRLPADLAAISIRELMIGEEKEEEDNDRPYWDYFSRRDQGEEKEANPHEGFRVVADVENNRLLLRANEAEMAEVRNLLAELGEIPAERRDSRPVRFIQPGGDAAQMLEQLRRVWPALGDNELIINVPEKTEPAEPDQKKPETDRADQEPLTDRSASAAGRPGGWLQFAQLEVPSSARADAEAASEPAEKPAGPPSVTITVTRDGRLMLSSSDTAALDRLEELVDQISPPEKRFKVFRLKYVTAYNMYLTLTDYFREELEGGEGKYILDWWGRSVRTGSGDETTGLASRRKLLITWDTPSRTILVANASPSQLYDVEQLVQEYDRPAPEDSIKSRRTAAIKIRYSRASVIAAALKDVYRDLLSTRDKEFQSGDKKEQQANQERVTVIRYGDTSEDGEKRSAPVKVGFEGALSVGADDVSNMLIVSVQEELFEDVVKMVHELDEEAAPKTTVHVHHVSSQVNAAALQKTLSDALGTPWPGGRPEKQTAAPTTGEKRSAEPGKKGDQASNSDE